LDFERNLLGIADRLIRGNSFPGKLLLWIEFLILNFLRLC